ncbi:MAG: transporter substrate-binding domain-containing protein, partial [Lachnospiraceae bacterium]|nr:transporter substrate-binding domain-containing protein [Lachnospiraceae bacterium]
MKKGNRKADYIIVGVLLLLFAAVIFSVAVRTKQTSGISPGEYPEQSSGQNGTIVDHSTPVSYFSGKTIGTGTGNVFDDIIEKSIPGVQMQYYNVYPDMLTALINEKIDAICIDEPVIKYILAQNTYPVEILDEKLENYSYGFVFPKTEQGEELRDEFNEFIEDLKESGELDEIENRWFSANPDTSVIPDGDETASPKGTLELAVDTTNPPFVYLDTGRPVGYEIDIAHRFCREYGYRLEIRDMSFDAIISSISSEMCDFGCSVITITEERKQSVYFSEPDYNGGAVLVVK